MRFFVGMFMLFAFTSLYGQYAEIGSITSYCERNGDEDIRGAVDILFVGEGDISQYDYEWSHDANEQGLSIDNLEAGTYFFYIQDRFGCSQTLEIIIPNSSSCSGKLVSYWNSKTCQYTVSAQITSSDGSALGPNAINIEWNYRDQTGQTIIIPFSSDQQALEVCADYNLPDAEGQSCCSGTLCTKLQFPSDQKPCGIISDGCKVVINEIGKVGSSSYVELLVVAPEAECDKGCDIRGVIVDDNNGDLVADPLPLDNLYSGNINEGYLKFKDVENWQKVPSGSIIVVQQNIKDVRVYEDPTDRNNDNVYAVYAGNSRYFDGFTDNPSADLRHYSFTGFPTAPSWDYIEPSIGYDGIQSVNSDLTVNHAVTFGVNARSHLGQSSSVSADFDLADANPSRFVVALSNKNYDSSEAYDVSDDSRVASPGRPNSSENEVYINNLRNCKGQKNSLSPTVSSITNLSMTVAPNPVSTYGYLVFTSGSSQNVQLKYSAANGAHLAAEDVNLDKGETIVPISKVAVNQPAGVYTVGVYSSNRFLFSRRIIVTK